MHARSPDDVLRPMALRPASTGLFCDFDGTLSGIVEDPSAAEPLPGAADLLGRLAQVFALVGVISGRPGRFLATHFGGRGLFLSGLYGLEMVVDGEVTRHPGVEPWVAAVEEVADGAEASGPPDVGVERKGLSVTLHYRTAPERRDDVRRWAEEAARATGLAVHAARMSYELRPPLPLTKGTVLADVTAGLEQAVFVGDDHADLEAFDVLDGFAAAGGTAVRVAVASAEAPPALLERADLVVAGPPGVLAVLEGLLLATS